MYTCKKKAVYNLPLTDSVILPIILCDLCSTNAFLTRIAFVPDCTKLYKF